MHIPDGFLSTPVWLALDAAAAPAVVYAARRASRGAEEARIPLLGVMGAFVFAAQMVNFPVAAGASAHLVGGALLAITLGPAAAMVVMTAILGIQAFVFQDGGVLALGANILNMGFAGVLAGYLPYHFWGRRRLAFFAGGALSVMASALLALAELLASGVPMPGSVLPVSLGIFAAGALAEGAITVAALEGISALNAGFIRPAVSTPRRTLGAIAVGSALLAAVGVMFASARPDGLQALAARIGITDRAYSAVKEPLVAVPALALIGCVALLARRFALGQRSA